MDINKSVKDFLQEWCYRIDKERSRQANETSLRITSISINGKDIEETEISDDIMEFEFPKW